jgi:hypothetical protein
MIRGSVAVAILLGSVRAAAFGIPVHERIAPHAFARNPALLQRKLPPLGPSDLAGFWRWLRAQALAALPEAERGELFRRWPEGDAFALKVLLAMNPVAKVVGIDIGDDAPDLGAQLARASAHPDRDFRDRDKLAFGEDRRPISDRHGNPVPDDPAILNMGKISGVSSQAHAHYGLLPGPLSDDPEVLESEPQRFAAARTPGAPQVLTLAAERAQLHADLALLAGLWGGPGAERLAALFTGAGWHYLQDVCSQVHTVQVGIRELWVAAKLEYWKRAALTLGGYLGDLRPFTSIGVDFIANHHLWVEAVGARALEEAVAGRGPLAAALVAMADDAPDLPAERVSERYAEEITRQLIARSAPEGPLLYRAAYEATRSELRTYGFEISDEDPEPERFLRDGAGATLTRIHDLARAGLVRAATGMRRWWRIHEGLVAAGRGGPDLVRATVRRLFQDRLRYRREAEARRAAYLDLAPAPEKPLREPAWIAIDLGGLAVLALIAWGVVRVARRFRRRRS